jgi:hypothetical protein
MLHKRQSSNLWLIAELRRYNACIRLFLSGSVWAIECPPYQSWNPF